MSSATITKICEVCGLEFIRPRHRVKWQALRFCSRKCHSKTIIGKDNHNYKGGHISKEGYCKIHIDGKQIYRSRYTMEQHIGRKLVSTEHVHHINGNRSDDRLENLELWTKAHPCGQKVEDKINWAIDFLRQYDYHIGYINNGLGL